MWGSFAGGGTADSVLFTGLGVTVRSASWRVRGAPPPAFLEPLPALEALGMLHWAQCDLSLTLGVQPPRSSQESPPQGPDEASNQASNH